MNFKLLLIVFSVVFLTSCNNKKVFEKHHDFEKFIWHKSEIVEFEVDIKDKDIEYDVFVAVRYITQFPLKHVKIGLAIESPHGEKRFKAHDLLIKNEDGSNKGDGLGDIWDVEVPVYKNKLFAVSGVHKFSIENRMHLIDMPGIMAMGIVLRKS